MFTKKRATVNFDTSREDGKLLIEIARRAVLAAHRAKIDYDFQSAVMDVTAAHCNGCRLRLAELLAADDFDFNHDVFGIRRHIDRQTGELGGCFVPRFATRQ